jgi:Na+/proline symporter
MLYLNMHRMGVIVVIGLMLWIGAYAYYAKPSIRQYLLRGKPHRWSVDLASRKATSRGRTEV